METTSGPAQEGCGQRLQNPQKQVPWNIDPPKPDFLKFTADGVHLTDRAGSKLYKLKYELSLDFFKQEEDGYPSGMDTGDESETLNIAEQDIEIVKTPAAGISKQAKRPGPNSGRPSKRPRSNPRMVNIDDDEEDEGNAFSLSHPDFRKLMKDFASLKSQVIKR